MPTCTFGAHIECQHKVNIPHHHQLPRSINLYSLNTPTTTKDVLLETEQTPAPTTKQEMPLVIPGLMSQDSKDDKTSQWQTKLMGKKIGDASNETVSSFASYVLSK